MSSRRVLVGLATCAVCGVVVAGCSSSSGTSAEGVVAPDDLGTTASVPALLGTTCAGFEHRYVGGGLTVDLPADVAQVSGEATADPGPVHASESHDFLFASSTVAVGRRVGSDVVDEPLVSERVSNGVVLFARASDDDLRACLLASMRYEQGEDMRDD